MIIFLDVDGVIATKESYEKEEDRLDRRCIASLNELILGFNRIKIPCNIVITSHWRYMFPLKTMQAILEGVGVLAPVIDATESNPQDRRRDNEIFAWLEKHYGGDEWIAIDDDKFDMTNLPPDKFIWIEKGFLKGGLTKGIVERFLKMYRHVRI